MGVVGSVFGVLFGKGVLLLIQGVFADKLPPYMTYGLRSWSRRARSRNWDNDLNTLFSAAAASHSTHKTKRAPA